MSAALDRGSQVDKRYEVYCLADPLFYGSTTQVREERLDFEFMHWPVPAGWERSELEEWLVHRPTGTPFSKSTSQPAWITPTRSSRQCRTTAFGIGFRSSFCVVLPVAAGQRQVRTPGVERKAAGKTGR